MNKPFSYQSSLNKNRVLQSAKIQKKHASISNTFASQIVRIFSLAKGENYGAGEIRFNPLSFVSVWFNIQICKHSSRVSDLQNLQLEYFIQHWNIQRKWDAQLQQIWPSRKCFLSLCGAFWKKRLSQAECILLSTVIKTKQVWGTSSVSARMLRTFLSLLDLNISSFTCALPVSPQEHAEGHWAGRGTFWIYSKNYCCALSSWTIKYFYHTDYEAKAHIFNSDNRSSSSPCDSPKEVVMFLTFKAYGSDLLEGRGEGASCIWEKPLTTWEQGHQPLCHRLVLENKNKIWVKSSCAIL